MDTEVYEIEGGLSISFPLFIEFFDSIIEVIRHVNDEVTLTEDAKQIIGFTRDLLDTRHCSRRVDYRGNTTST